MPDVLHIPGVETFHPRESWQDPAWPITGPLDNPANNDSVVIHYTAADDLIDGDPGEHADDLPQYLRNMQHAYAKPKAQGGRGYSIGYLFAVDWLGGVWQQRGWEFQSAANLAHNEHTFPILVLVDGNDAATDEAAASIRALVAEAQRRAGRTLKIKGHGQLRLETGVGTATSCPGVGLQAQVNAGVFTPRPPATPSPPPIIPEETPTMIRLSFAQPGQPTTIMLWNGINLAWVENGHADAVLSAAEVTTIPVTRDQLHGVVLASRTTTRAPYTLDADLAQAWDMRAE